MARYQGIPDLIYGTAFKFENSTALVEAALKAGFRGIDTAGSAAAYREKLVGDAIKTALAGGDIAREDLYIQTKFSPYKAGKDPSLYPYDVTADIATRIAQSLESSLSNLGTDYIDCLVLHSLYPTVEETLQAWRELEKYVPSKISSLGVSNTDLQTLRILFEAATVKPAVVQNRFTEDDLSHPNPQTPPGVPYAEDPYDRVVRQFCWDQNITYTPWGLLWGNPALVDDLDALVSIAAKVGVTKELALYACLKSLKGCEIRNLCGTSNVARMTENLEGMKRIEAFVAHSKENRIAWEQFVAEVQDIVDG